MVGGDNSLWADVRRAYEGDELTVAAICRKFALKPAQLAARRTAEGWLTRPFPMRKGWAQRGGLAARTARGQAPDRRSCEPDSAAPAKTKELASSSVAPESRGGEERSGGQQHATPVASRPWIKRDRGRLIKRLFTAIETELTIIEGRMKDSENRSPADSERDTRSIGALIRNLEKLTEFDEQLSGRGDKHRGGGAKSGAVADITADEADRIRRDLAQRIERITKG